VTSLAVTTASDSFDCSAGCAVGTQLTTNLQAFCGGGTHAFGGGATLTGANQQFAAVNDTFPISSPPIGWQGNASIIQALASGASGPTMTVYAVCG
jgi:hypothetical protein